MVAPDARVRHREVVAGGLEPLAAGSDSGGRHAETMQVLQRRHELRAVLKCYTWFHLVRVVPQAALLALGEIVVALFARDGERVRAVAGAWWWNARHLGEIRALRRKLATNRMLGDSEVRRLQLRGSARLSRYLSMVSHHGLEAANAVAARRRPGHAPERSEVALLTGSVGLAFSEDADFDQLDDLGHRAGRDRFGHKVRAPFLATGRQRAVALLVALLVVALGTRDLFFGTLPLVGQLAPLPSWSTSWHHFFSGWQSAGVGTTAPSSPAFGLTGLSGTILLGAMGTLQRVLLLGCIPLGAWGMSRLARPLLSARARVIAVICYLGIPLPYAALGTGRWDGLVAYAAFPFILLALARAAGVEPYAAGAGTGPTSGSTEGTTWRSRPLGRVAVLGALIATAAAFAPAVVPMVIVSALAWEVGGVLAGSHDGAGRVLGRALAGVGVALVLLAPWVLGTLLAGRASIGIFGLPISGASAPGWGEVVRFAIGPAARSPVVWLLVAAAALPLVLGRGIRLLWAARLWVVACASWGFALATSRGDLGSFTPSESVVLAPAAVAVALCVGLGISAFENDLSGRAFGWRQVVTVVALAFVVVGLAPVAVAAAGGRWGLPEQGVDQQLGFLSHPSTGVARVLWLGDPRALPVGGWSVQDGLAYAVTPESLPTTEQVLAPAGAGPAGQLGEDVRLAMSGGTVHLGRLLAPAGVRYVVVVDALAPSMAGGSTPSVSAPAPAGLVADLLAQDDLQAQPGVLGLQVFANGAAMPVTAERVRARGGSWWILDTGRGGRDRLAARAGPAGRRRAGERTGLGRHPVRRVRARRQLRPLRGRAGRGVATGVRVGGAVHRGEGDGLAGALAVPSGAPGRDARAPRVGGPGGGAGGSAAPRGPSGTARPGSGADPSGRGRTRTQVRRSSREPGPSPRAALADPGLRGGGRRRSGDRRRGAGDAPAACRAGRTRGPGGGTRR